MLPSTWSPMMVKTSMKRVIRTPTEKKVPVDCMMTSTIFLRLCRYLNILKTRSTRRDLRTRNVRRARRLLRPPPERMKMSSQDMKTMKRSKLLNLSSRKTQIVRPMIFMTTSTVKRAVRTMLHTAGRDRGAFPVR